MTPIGELVRGKKGLIVGIANEGSIAFGCGRVLHRLGAELAVTYLNAKAEKWVRPLAEELASPIIMPLDVEVPGELDAVFAAISRQWGKLDFVIHSIAFAPRDDLHGRVVDVSREGFEQAMRVSCYSLIEMTRAAEPLMAEGGTILTMSYYGAEKVLDNYNIMGPVKAALESTTRYLAHELGQKGIRLHALSPGPLKTRAAGGIAGFDELLSQAAARAPQGRVVTIDEVGQVAAFLISDAATGMTGNTIYVDAGYHIMG